MTEGTGTPKDPPGLKILVVIQQDASAAYVPALIACMHGEGWTVMPHLAGKDGFIGRGLLSALCGPRSSWHTAAADTGVDAVVALANKGPDGVDHLENAMRKAAEGVPHTTPMVLASCAETDDLSAPNPERQPCRSACIRLTLPLPQALNPSDPVGHLRDCCETICEHVRAALTSNDLAGHTVLVTAGPTVESLDPVRYLTNRSTGRMGVALAKAAWRRGAAVELIHGPLKIRLPTLDGLRSTSAQSAADMYTAVIDRVADADIAIMCAAVADVRPAVRHAEKLKKDENGLLSIPLEPTPDILAELGRRVPRPFLVGFAAETRNMETYARRKLEAKNCDLICANDVAAPDSGFAVDTNRITIYARNGTTEQLPLCSKNVAAERILETVVRLAPKISDSSSITG